MNGQSTITAISQHAQRVFKRADEHAIALGLDTKFPTLSVLNNMARVELTNPHEVEGIPLFAGLGGFAVASVDMSGSFSPGGGNSGRGPQGRA